MANENWVKAKGGVKQFVPMLTLSTAIIVGYALLVRIFVKAGK